MVKAIQSVMAGGPETLVMNEVADPQPGPHDVVIAVKACALNFPDVLIIQDLYQMRPPRPFSPGAEVAGVIDAVGAEVKAFKPGDRVIAVTGHGGLAERVVVPAAMLHRLPHNRGFAEGSALLLTYATSIHALVDRGRLREGDNLLVLGAAGGVGLAAVELGAAFGARVIAAVSSEEKASMARAAGAHDVVIYPHAPFDRDQSKALAEAFKAKLGSGGANVIYDAVGGDYCEPALRSTAWEGRYLVVGFPAGIPKLPLNLTLLKSCDVCGVFWGAFAARNPEANTAHIARLFRLWSDGKINPRVTRVYPFAEAAEAVRALGAREAVGKLVVEVSA